MHAAPGHAAAGPFAAILPPVVAAETVDARPAEIALDVQELAEPAVREHARDLLQRRLEAPIVTDRERHLVPGAGFDRRGRILERETERLLGEYMLARARGGDDLLRVHGMRRRQHDRVDRGIGQHRLVARLHRNAMLAAEFLGACRRARGAGDELDDVALTLHMVHEVLTPAARADDRGTYHAGLAGMNFRSLFCVHVAPGGLGWASKL